MSTQPTPPPEKAPVHDLEAGNLGLLDSNGGASLRRQISVQLTSEQFERLYLQPGGAKAKGDLAKVRSHAQIATLFCDLLCSPLRLFDCSAVVPRSDGTDSGSGDQQRFGNPTPLGIASFLLCLTPFSCYLMGYVPCSTPRTDDWTTTDACRMSRWVGTSTAAAATLVCVSLPPLPVGIPFTHSTVGL